MALAILAILLGIVTGQPMVKKGPCDDTRECIRYQFTGADRQLCFGYYGCKGASMGSSSTALCSGANACTRATFSTNNKQISCNGFKSCQRGRQMSNNNKIACNGIKACVDVVGGLTAPKIMCDGDVACTNFNSKKNSALSLNLNAEGGATDDDNLLYCNGNQVCRNTQQRSVGLIYCDGDGACKDSRQQAKEVQCQGKRACKDSVIQPLSGTHNEIEKLTCHGWFGCADTNVIMATEIQAYGFNSMVRSVIETRGQPTFNLKAFGFRAMAGASIDCKGTACTVECKGNACKGLPIAVAKSSTLTMIPDACDPNSVDCIPARKPGISACAKVAGVHCPTINYARADTTDEEMTAWLQAKVYEWEQTEEYQEYLEIQDIAEQEASLYIEERLRDYEMLNEYDDDEDEIGQKGESYLFGGNVSLQTQIASSLITSNLLTAIAVFLLTGGVIRVIFNKYRGDYKTLQ